MLGVLPPTNPAKQIRLFQVAKGCLILKVRVVLLFATKSVHVARFTSPGQTCFAASDETSVYGLSPA